MRLSPRLGALLTAAAMLVGCAVSDINLRTLNFAALDLQANSPELQSAAENAIALIELDGDSPYQLSMVEKLGNEVAALASKSHVAKRQLHYLLTYKLINSGGIAYEGNFRFSQIFDNDERTHRANLLERDRFYLNAREAGIDSMLSHLRLWATN